MVANFAPTPDFYHEEHEGTKEEGRTSGTELGTGISHAKPQSRKGAKGQRGKGQRKR